MKKSKLGIHLLGHPYPQQYERIVQAQVPHIKIISKLGDMRWLKDRMPNTTFVQRYWDSQKELGDDFTRFLVRWGLWGQPKRAAEKWIELMSPILEEHPDVWYETYNEFGDWDNLDQFVAFEREVAYRLHDRDIRIVAGNFAYGNPPEQYWKQLYPLWQTLHEINGVFSVHPYAVLSMSMYVGRNQEPVPEQDYDSRSEAEWLIALRKKANQYTLDLDPYTTNAWLFGVHRNMWANHLIPNGWGDVEFMGTEFGYAYGSLALANDLAGGEPTGFYKNLGPAWSNAFGVTDPAQFYIDELMRVEDWMKHDKEVLGVDPVIGLHIYMWGKDNIWDPLDINGKVTDYLLNYWKNLPDEEDENENEGEDKPIVIDETTNATIKVINGYRVKLRTKPSLARDTDTGLRLPLRVGNDFIRSGLVTDTQDVNGNLWCKILIYIDGTAREYWTCYEYRGTRLYVLTGGTLAFNDAEDITNKRVLHWPVGRRSDRTGALPEHWTISLSHLKRYNLCWYASDGKKCIKQVHLGIDLNLNTPVHNADAGQPVYAAAPGTVLYAQRVPRSTWGNLVVIAHADHLIATRYAHLQDILVSVGDVVDENTLIGHVGRTGNVISEHLHWDVVRLSVATENPRYWAGSNITEAQTTSFDPLKWIKEE